MMNLIRSNFVYAIQIKASGPALARGTRGSKPRLTLPEQLTTAIFADHGHLVNVNRMSMRT
jgi:hypothetical protein